MWVFGSGFPKSHNIGKAVDKIEGNDREVVGKNVSIQIREKGLNINKEYGQSDGMFGKYGHNIDVTKGTSPYEGWGTALKPAHEPVVMARKPFKGTVAKNVLEHGTGGINIDECRVGTDEITTNGYGDKGFVAQEGYEPSTHQGRFPANIIFDEEAGKILDEQSGTKTGQRGVVKGTEPSHSKKNNIYGDYSMVDGKYAKPKDDLGGASRFFYCPKASKKDRNDGNIHPTVKPTDLMAYLVRLVTPKGGTVLDPFMGSGSTGKASVREGMNFIGIEREDEYMEIAKSRIEHEQGKNKHREFFDEV